ncbi:MAG: ABC transporter substrate binding protein, partial [Ketobacteraceae bacterium]|nr:ABC transporter substrate binding protein [Ketobacteraceae bacterium]
MKTASLVMTLWAFAFSVCAFSARAEGSVAASEGVQPESGEGNNGQHAVLLLSSYHPGFPTFFDQVEGVQSVLNTPAIQLDIEFMDSKRFNRRQLNDIFYANLKRKLNRLPGYDLIIAADDAATHFAVEHQSELFNDAPIVFFGVNDMAYAKSLAGRPNVTGIMERAAIKETVELINSLFRQHEVVVITDGSFTANSDTKRFKEEMAAMGFDRFRVVSLEELSFEEMFSEIRNLPSNSGILLISLFRDRAGEVREFKRTLRDIRRATTVPIFHLWYHGLGEGVLGGKLLSHRTQAEAAAKIGLKILKGENDQQPWDIMDTPTEYVFDYNELSRHKIALDRLPEEAIIVNAPDPLLQRYRSYFLGFAVFVLLLGVVIVVLMLNIRARRRHEEEVTRLNEELEEKVSERTAALREAHFEVAKVLRFQDSILDN